MQRPPRAVPALLRWCHICHPRFLLAVRRWGITSWDPQCSDIRLHWVDQDSIRCWSPATACRCTNLSREPILLSKSVSRSRYCASFPLRCVAPSWRAIQPSPPAKLSKVGLQIYARLDVCPYCIAAPRILPAPRFSRLDVPSEHEQATTDSRAFDHNARAAGYYVSDSTSVELQEPPIRPKTLDFRTPLDRQWERCCPGFAHQAAVSSAACIEHR